MSIRVMLVDDHRIMREGLRALLQQQPDLQVVAEVGDGRTAVQQAIEHAPDVVIMDITLPDLNGIEATRLIKSSVANVKVIALSMHEDRRLLVEMLKAGASGYLLKNCAYTEILTAVKAVMADQPYLCQKMANTVLVDYLQQLPEGENEADTHVTARERQVLQLLAEGKTSKQIATVLEVSLKTIETHRHQLMRKLNCHSIAELTRYAIRQGLTPP